MAGETVSLILKSALHFSRLFSAGSLKGSLRGGCDNGGRGEEGMGWGGGDRYIKEER